MMCYNMGIEVNDPFAISVLLYGPLGKHEIDDDLDDDVAVEMCPEIILSIENVIEDVDINIEDFES